MIKVQSITMKCCFYVDTSVVITQSYNKNIALLKYKSSDNTDAPFFIEFAFVQAHVAVLVLVLKISVSRP